MTTPVGWGELRQGGITATLAVLACATLLSGLAFLTINWSESDIARDHWAMFLYGAAWVALNPIAWLIAALGVALWRGYKREKAGRTLTMK